ELARHDGSLRGLPHSALGLLRAAAARSLADDPRDEGALRRDPEAPPRGRAHGDPGGARRGDPRAPGARATALPGVLRVAIVALVALAAYALVTFGWRAWLPQRWPGGPGPRAPPPPPFRRPGYSNSSRG